MSVHTEMGNPLNHLGNTYRAIYRHRGACPVCQRRESAETPSLTRLGLICVDIFNAPITAKTATYWDA